MEIQLPGYQLKEGESLYHVRYITTLCFNMCTTNRHPSGSAERMKQKGEQSHDASFGAAVVGEKACF